jgi:hypothetical protein
MWNSSAQGLGGPNSATSPASEPALTDWHISVLNTFLTDNCQTLGVINHLKRR